MRDLPTLKIGNDGFTPVRLKHRYTGTLLMGKSGGGKSKLIENMYFQDEFYKNSKILIDPSGELSRNCYSISRGKAHYCSLKTPVSINPMLLIPDTDTISDIIAEAINQVIALTTPNQILTVKMRGILDNAIKYCLSHERKSLISVRDYIQNLTGDHETRDGIIQRLNFLLSDERMVKIICGNNSVKWGELIAKGENFIMDCFGMSKDKMIFVGNLITQGIKSYFRNETPKDRKPVSLYIDEAHNFVNLNFFDILKEGRRYKISCLMATQDFASIRDQALVRVMLNVGNIISFAIGYNEAQLIARELNIRTEEVQFLEKYHFAYLTRDGKGFAKAPSPLFIRPIEPKVELSIKSDKFKWFDLESYQPEAQP